MRLFILKNIELIEITDDPYCNNTLEHYEFLLHPVKPEDAAFKVTREMVEGRVFINERNEKICFGMSKQAEKMLGMSFDTIDTLSKQVDMGNEIIDTLRAELYKVKNMSLIDRIISVFKKYKITCI